jgi:hypothetical protein
MQQAGEKMWWVNEQKADIRRQACNASELDKKVA